MNCLTMLLTWSLVFFGLATCSAFLHALSYSPNSWIASRKVRFNPMSLQNRHHQSQIQIKQHFNGCYFSKKEGFQDDLFDDDDDEKASDTSHHPEVVDNELGNNGWKFDDSNQIVNDDDVNTHDIKVGEADRHRVTDDPVANKEWDLEEDYNDVEAVPTLALMYRFRANDEFSETELTNILSAHDEYCKSFPRLLHSEVLDVGESKGAVILWALESSINTNALLSDIKAFLSGDPLYLGGFIAEHEIIDLNEAAREDSDKK